MRQPEFKKGEGLSEKRIAFIERVVARLARRTKNKSNIIMTPYPISNCVTGESVSGPILKYMFCAIGEIEKLMIHLEGNIKDGAQLNVSVMHESMGEEKSFHVSKGRSVFPVNLLIGAGDRLSVSIKPLGADQAITEAWVSFLWTPSIKEAKVKQFLIDELLDDVEGEHERV